MLGLATDGKAGSPASVCGTMWYPMSFQKLAPPSLPNSNPGVVSSTLRDFPRRLQAFPEMDASPSHQAFLPASSCPVPQKVPSPEVAARGCRRLLDLHLLEVPVLRSLRCEHGAHFGQAVESLFVRVEIWWLVEIVWKGLEPTICMDFDDFVSRAFSTW